ncbi:ScyD/ScyE family protein [Rhizobium mesoamericanum]|uniref:ScyD/ScyE family protein n=1 Tax=Rhizobium mesoamericanum TaxID=1079800 RepID=UPI0002EA60B3|nr:ScyD/ScyE family protein [Rhizobium mesoamericanum]
MRPFCTLIVVTDFLLLAAGAGAEPTAAPGYTLQTFNTPGAAFAGLSYDAAGLLVSDLASGRLFRRGADGKLVAFGPIFPHGLDVIGDPTGPYRVVRTDDGLVVAQGWTPVSSKEDQVDHALVALDPAGQIRVINSDFWNPFDFVAANGGYYVVDSARNSIERVLPDGSKSTLLTFRRVGQAATALRSLSPTEFTEGNSYETDAVPTGIALYGGRLYIALFGGFPFLAGAGRIVSIPEAGDQATPEIDVEALNAPLDIAFESSGEMLVLEHGTYDQKDGFRNESGRLLKFNKMMREPKVILEGLTRPVSVLVWDEQRIVVSALDGNLYILTREAAR